MSKVRCKQNCGFCNRSES